MSSSENLANKPGKLERALLWYARRFPISIGKLRLIDTACPLAAGDDPWRTASLIHGGFKVPCDLRDMLQRQFYFFGTYYLERELLACWSRLATGADVIFDIGANAGIYSLAALAANPGAEVHAFEPTPEIAERLRAAADINGLIGLHIHETAIGNASGLAGLVRCRGENNANDGMNYVRINNIDSTDLHVNIDRIDNFCSESGVENIDLLKIDIQGSEADALIGASRLLRNARIKYIFVELNGHFEDGMGAAVDVVSILSEHDFLFSRPGKTLVWRGAGAWLNGVDDVIAGHSSVAGID